MHARKPIVPKTPSQEANDTALPVLPSAIANALGSARPKAHLDALRDADSAHSKKKQKGAGAGKRAGSVARPELPRGGHR